MMRRTSNRRMLPAIAMLAVLTGCLNLTTRRQDESETVRYTGQIQVTGTEGMTLTVIVLESGQSMGISGPLLPEIRRLSGATLMVEGTPVTSGMPGPGMEVQRYEVVEVNGQRPWVGVLTRNNDVWTLESDSGVVRLAPPPDALARELGARVWVTGSMSGDRVQVQSFGVIRPR